MKPGSLRYLVKTTGKSMAQIRAEVGGKKGLTPAQARGHGGGARAAVQLSGWVTATNGERRFVAATGPAAVARLAARLHDEREVASGRLPPSVFADRWRGRQVGGVRVSARSAVVNASLHRAGAETEVRYLRGGRK